MRVSNVSFPEFTLSEKVGFSMRKKLVEPSKTPYTEMNITSVLSMDPIARDADPLTSPWLPDRTQPASPLKPQAVTFSTFLGIPS